MNWQMTQTLEEEKGKSVTLFSTQRQEQKYLSVFFSTAKCFWASFRAFCVVFGCCRAGNVAKMGNFILAAVNFPTGTLIHLTRVKLPGR